MSKIKSFRGLIPTGGQDTITLHTNDGSIGYRIVKFQVIPNSPSVLNPECIVKIWKTKQTTPVTDITIDFNDNRLLAAAYYSGNASSNFPEDVVIIFDNEKFNQDIYITSKDNSDTESMNYYLELEQIKLDLNENTVATLKDIRNLA